MTTRIGFGYDIHRLVEGRKLRLGGIEIAHTKGLLGHSDADVLLHAIADALLGAAALRDIGYHFPNDAAATDGMASTVLLARSVAMVRDKGYEIANIDTTIIAETPLLTSYIPAMCATIATILGIDSAQVSVKATTNEKIDSLGSGNSIAVLAVALIYKKD